MITDEQRHEVAQELRRQAVYSSGSLGEWWQRLQDTVTGEIDFANPQETYLALADLIDRPMTRNIAEPPEFKCELCGAEWPFEMGFVYCPECGAEVIVDD